MSQQADGVTKRRFLQGVGAAAGAAAVYRSLQALGLEAAGDAQAAAPDLPRGSGRGVHVAILGAGISGMTAAHELSRAGYRCTILEADRRAGGRSLTARGGDVVEETDSRQRVDFDLDGDLYANLGPARIPHHHRALLGYCKEFGVALEVFTNDNRAALFHDRARFGGEPVTARRALADTRGYVAELLAKAAAGGALDDVLTAADRERLLEMLVAYGDLDGKRRYAGSTRGGYRGAAVNAGFGDRPASDPLDLGELLRADFWRYKLHFDDFLDQHPTLLQPVGGMDAIARAFLRRVGPLIRYGSVVEQIRRTSGGVRAVYRQRPGGTVRALDADYAVCTIPAPVLKDIPSDFSAETRAAIAGTAFEPAVKIAFQARRRFWEDDAAIYGGISWTDQDITQIWYPSHGYHRRNGIVMGAYVWDAEPALRYAAMAPRRRLAAATAEGERLHPGYAGEIGAGVSRAWSKAPFQKGAWPAYRKLPDALRRPDGPVHFAGDQATALPGWQEGAVIAARAAVRAIGERVARRRG